MVQKLPHVTKISLDAKLKELKSLVISPASEKDVLFKVERFMFLCLGTLEKLHERIEQVGNGQGV